MEIERRTAANTAIVLIDYVTGFANMIGSQTIAENIGAARALAQTALAFDVPLVITLGPQNDPRGGLYSEVAEVIGDHPIVHRPGSFDAFDYAGFEAAIEATGRRHLVVGGLMTDGCVLHTCVSARRRDYGVSLVADASAAANEVGQAVAIQRLTSLGATLTTWLTFASELQQSYENTETLDAFRRIQANSPGYGNLHKTIVSAVMAGQAAPAWSAGGTPTA